MRAYLPTCWSFSIHRIIIYKDLYEAHWWFDRKIGWKGTKARLCDLFGPKDYPPNLRDNGHDYFIRRDENVFEVFFTTNKGIEVPKQVIDGLREIFPYLEYTPFVDGKQVF